MPSLPPKIVCMKEQIVVKKFLYRLENKVGLGFFTRKNIKLISLVQPNMLTKATFILLFIYHIS